jgi:hypothetical protein
MKTGTYQRNGKSEIIEINSKMGENRMKLDTYQKQNCLWPNYPKVWIKPLKGIKQFPKIVNEKRESRNELRNEFTLAYQIVVNEIWQYTFSMDNLHDTMIRIIDMLNKGTLELKEDKPLHYLKRACIVRWKEVEREKTRHNLLTEKNNSKKVIDNSRDGITLEFITETINSIKEVLTDFGYELFTWYHVDGLTIREIAKKIPDCKKSRIGYEITKMNNRIDELKISYLYDKRYLDYTNKSKHNHISTFERKQLAKLNDKEYKKQFEGLCFKVDKSNYIPQEKTEIDYTNLHHTYGVWTCQKQIKVENFGYTKSAENYTMYKKEGIIKNVYSESIVFDLPKPISWKELGNNRYSKSLSVYRMKKYQRQYIGKSKRQKRIDKYKMYLKHGRYLEYMD